MTTHKRRTMLLKTLVMLAACAAAAPLRAGEAAVATPSPTPDAPGQVPANAASGMEPATDRSATPEAAVSMEKMEVSGTREVSMNSIDRKVYTVGKDLVSASGSVSNLLQNIPSINVDVEGKVSLRGSESVTILIDGRSSPLMGKTRAEVLEQLPADSIERIEVITNPSAKYKPDGTAGIINLVTRRKPVPGYTGSLTLNAGTEQRGNATASFNTSSKGWSFSGTAGLRKDDRVRRTLALRETTEVPGGATTREIQDSRAHSRPLTRLIKASLLKEFGKHDELEFSGSFLQRTLTMEELAHTLVSPEAPTSDFTRGRDNRELQKEHGLDLRYRHSFDEDGHELSSELKVTRNHEQEDNAYTEEHRLPVAYTSQDSTLIIQKEAGSEWVNEYTLPLSNEGKLEAGYSREYNQGDFDFRGAYLQPGTGEWLTDQEKTNRFIHTETLHAAYVTLSAKAGRFGALGGLRMEKAFADSRLVNTGESIPNDYFRLYPSLHLAFALTTHQELQLNYSHRVHRPEADDMNPFAEYQDPRHVRVGNPRLKPEDIHSVELGHQYKTDGLSLVNTVYFRQRTNGMTDFVSVNQDGVEVRTKANLGKSKAGGLELAADAQLWKAVSLNFSTNLFAETIDASNLGFSASKSAFSGLAKLGLSIHAGKHTLIQVNGSCTSSRLTPQGHRGASQVANLGLRHDFERRNLSLVLTLSDVFNSLSERTSYATPTLSETIVRRRSPRGVYLGLIYRFGNTQKKAKDDALKFDDSL